MAHFSATISDEPGRLRVALAGECDMAVRDELCAVLLGAVRRSRVVVVDLARVGFLDSSGVHGLIAAYKEARDRGGRLLLENPTGVVATVLDVTGVAELLARTGESRPGETRPGESSPDSSRPGETREGRPGEAGG
jgi:anti-anti-sigma factor